MIPRFIKINGFTKENRYVMTGNINDAIHENGAWILDFKQYSNKSLVILFQMPVRDIGRLHTAILGTGLKITEESEKLLADCDAQQKLLGDESIFDIYGTLQLTFIHDEPEMRRYVPPFDL